MLNRFEKILSIFIFLYFSSFISAYEVSIEPALLYHNRGDDTAYLVIENTLKDTLAIEVIPHLRVPSKNTFEKDFVDTKDFIVMPNKLILLPNQERRVQLKYRGASPKADKVYFFTTKQIEVKRKEQKKGININILLNYQKKLTLSSTKFKERVNVSAKKIVDSDLKPRLSLTFENIGTKVSRPYKYDGLQIKTSKGKFRIPEELYTPTGKELVLYPNETLTIDMIWPEEIPESASIKSVKFSRR